MLKPIKLRDLVDLIPAPMLCLVIPILVWMLIDYRLRRIRCSFCAAGYAFSRRAGGRACRSCKREIDRKIRDAMNPRGLHNPLVQKWIRISRSHR